MESDFLFKFFRRWIKDEKIAELQSSLLRAGMPTSPKAYVANAILMSTVAGAFGLLLGFLLFFMLLRFDAIVGFPGTIMLGVLMGFGIYQLQMGYPSFAAGSRANSININLPHAVTFLYAASSGGAGVVESFRSLAEQVDEYGEISKEAARIVREVEHFGVDVSSAISSVARTTPSASFMNFLDTLVTVLKTGGDVPEYLRLKSHEYRKEAEQAQKRSLETLSFFAEFYMVVFVLMPLMLVMIFLIFGIAGASYDLAIYAIIYIYIPIGNLGGVFALDIVIKGMGIRKIKFEKRSAFRRGVMEWFKGSPNRAFVITAPIGILVGTLTVLLLAQHWLVGLIAAYATAVAPVALIYETQIRTVKRCEKRIPDFLRTLSGALKAGLQLPRAIEALLHAPLGNLTAPVREMVKHMKMGGTAKEALEKFANMTRSGLISRITALIKKAVDAGGDISRVVDIAGDDIQTVQTQEKERSGTMVTYLIIIYVAFMVFLFVAYAISSYLTGDMAKMAPSTRGAGLGYSIIKAQMMRETWFSACTMQGLFSGFVAGKMSGGSIYEGLKHSLILSLICLIFFTLIIK
ncbi:MAG: type II secretion system F family protein [Candidatus Hadarchaeales archaeon]